MAQIVLGIGTSHSPQVSSEPSTWPEFAASDRERPSLSFRGSELAFDELVTLRAGERIGNYLNEEEWQRRHRASQRAISRLAAVLAEVAPDVVVIIGDDQGEMIHSDLQPTVTVYWGATLLLRPRTYPASVRPGIQAAGWSFGEQEREYRVAAELGEFIIGDLVSQGIDVASSAQAPGGTAMGHAFAFVHRRLMGDAAIPTVPVMLNTFFPPNRPTPGRAYEIGQAIARAIGAWPGSERVAVLASGGLSHFVIDEEFDSAVLKAIRERDGIALGALPADRFVSGTSEILNWIAAAGALEHLTMDLVDYVPSYRSEAGTGCAMGFAVWR